MVALSARSLKQISAGCLAVAAIAATSPAVAASERVLHAFVGSHDGRAPLGGLIDVGGTLYGTTSSGGKYGGICGFEHFCGTVFKVTTAGVEKVLDSFKGGSDGRSPSANLIKVGGTLYGTTANGGGDGCSGFGCGTVFSVTPAGVETVVYSFGGGSDGGIPFARLINEDGVFYGTTYDGGSTNCTYGFGGCGTVFQVTPSGAETVVYSFKGGSDGSGPHAGLIKLGITIYGTTEYGGASANCSSTYTSGCGTVFSIDPTTGAETVVYSFQGGNDGAYPVAAVINVGGKLYGTTEYGGTSANCSNTNTSGCGTVFSINPTTGAETVVHSFQSGSDGAYPAAALINVGGTLYGTTTQGGSANCSNTYTSGCGTVFSINPTTGAETVVYSFQGGGDGSFPEAALLGVGGTLYGTTSGYLGGLYYTATVFAVVP
jgi:uncharacterized repeat protein (TIGR03803 family)